MSRDNIELATRCLEAIATPKALSYAIQLRYGTPEFGSYMPDSDVTPYNNYRDFLANKIVSKINASFPGIDPEEKALDNFYESERICKETNDYLYYISTCREARYLQAREYNSIKAIRSEVYRIIGNLSFKAFRDKGFFGGFGGGATLSNARRNASAINKLLTQNPTVTPGCLSLIKALGKFGYSYHALNNMWERSDSPSEYDIVSGNRYTSVPKSWKTNRGIAIEPLVNAFVQRSLGQLLSHRLFRSTGIDIRSNPEKHFRMARSSSIERDLATVDLSMASDTIAYQFVKAVVPRSWWTFLSLSRCKYTSVNGEDLLLEKFSSMGNGFTFELETVLFLAIARAAVAATGSRKDFCKVSTYGDDIIVPDYATDELYYLLDLCGFKPNVEKSYSGSIPFRESCGGHFYNGMEFPYFHVKDSPKEPQEWITYANLIYPIIDHIPQMRSVHNWVIRQIPSNIRGIRGPEYLGSLTIRDDDKSKWTFKCSEATDWIEQFRVYLPIKKERRTDHFFSPRPGLAALYASLLTNDHAWFQRVGGYRLTWVPSVARKT